ncbi:MAG TPA: metalloregulator ArsR/SmtB family transcription factor [Thermomicrobiales bacterium]|nr:metalloregulator ArsR/SmtB family transcription factor [Thermomicrobiales bacterium]
MPYSVTMNAKPPTDCCSTQIIPVPLSGDAEAQLVAALKALADPTRLQIFRCISAQPESICVCEIVPRFQVSQPTISHHLKVLREAGLITVERRGVWAYYAVDAAGVAAFRSLFGAVSPVMLEVA